MHSLPELDYSALSRLADRILDNHAFILDSEQVKDWQLDDLMTYAMRECMLVLERMDRTVWRTAQAEKYRLEDDRQYQRAEAIKAMVTAEQQRRQSGTTQAAQPTQGAPKARRAPATTQTQYALYYRLLQESGLYDQFDGANGRTKKEMCIEIGERHGISADKFEQCYNRTKTDKANPKDLVAAIVLLSDRPEYEPAKKRAEDLLEVANGRLKRK